MRKGRRLPRSRIADSLGVSANYLYMIESGLRLPSLDLTLRIGVYFGVNPEWLKLMWVRDCVNLIEAKLYEQIT